MRNRSIITMRKIKLPLTCDTISALRPGDEVCLSGIIYTARDQVHKRLTAAIKGRKRLPFDLKGQVIYYCGPAGRPKGRVIGSCGPTTSSRMDEFTPVLLEAGLKGMIGKGDRCKEVKAAIKKYKAVYFLAYAGCGALLAKYVKSKRLIAYSELGPEAVYELEIVDFPVIVGIDCRGKDIFKQIPRRRA